MWGIAVAVFFVCAILYFNKGYQNKDFNSRIIMYGLGSLFFCLAIGRIFFFLSDLQVRGTYVNDMFYGDFNNYTSNYELFVLLAYSSNFIGATLFCFAFEIIIKRTKFILTTINIILIVFMLILPYNLSHFFSYIGSIISIVLIYYILFYFTKRSRVEIKAVSSFMLFGGTILFIGIALYGDLVKEYNIFPLILAPVFYILGAIISSIPTTVDIDTLPKASSYLLMVMIFVIIIIGSLVFSAFYYGLSAFILIGGLVIMSFLIYIFYYTMNIVKYELSSDGKNRVEGKAHREQQDYLAMFMKPQNISDEEVIFYREQKICLVCKEKLSRLIYMCPQCNALYCEKCSMALSSLENACWVCKSPIDESKPVRLPKKAKKKK